MPLILYGCKACWVGGPPADAPKTAADALARIDQLYRDGVPFFTKEVIQSAFEQIQQPSPDDNKVLIKGVDGAMVEFDNRLDATKRGPLEKDEEIISIKPALVYHCRAALKHNIWLGIWSEDRPPFSSVSLYHDTETRPLDPNARDAWPTPPSQQAVAEFFEDVKRRWRESDSCKRLLAILNSSAATHEINKVVAVSLGSLVHPRHPDAKESAPFQHAMLLTLREWVIKQSAGSPCYTQDPIYTEIDQTILAAHGVEIIDDPRAWLEMDDQSIVVSISSNVPSREMVADLARPAVVIWNRVTNNDYDQEGMGMMTDPCSPRVRGMLEGYEMVEFGADLDQFGDVVVYVRRCK